MTSVFLPLRSGGLWAGHLNLASTFLLPLALLLCVVWYEGKVGPITFIVVLAAILVSQLGISQEMFATATLFGGIALALAVIIDKNRRARHVRLAAYVLCAYVPTGIVLIPYLSNIVREDIAFVGRCTPRDWFFVYRPGQLSDPDAAHRPRRALTCACHKPVRP